MDQEDSIVEDNKFISGVYPIYLWGIYNVLKFLYRLSILQESSNYNQIISEIHSQINTNNYTRILFNLVEYSCKNVCEKQKNIISNLKKEYYSSILGNLSKFANNPDEISKLNTVINDINNNKFDEKNIINTCIFEVNQQIDDPKKKKNFESIKKKLAISLSSIDQAINTPLLPYELDKNNNPKRNIKNQIIYFSNFFHYLKMLWYYKTKSKLDMIIRDDKIINLKQQINDDNQLKDGKDSKESLNLKILDQERKMELLHSYGMPGNILKLFGFQFLPSKLARKEKKLTKYVFLQYVLFIIILITVIGAYLKKREPGYPINPINLISGTVVLGALFSLCASFKNKIQGFIFLFNNIVSPDKDNTFINDLQKSLIKLDTSESISLNTICYVVFKLFGTTGWVDLCIFMFVLYFICAFAIEYSGKDIEEDVDSNEETIKYFFIRIIIKAYIVALFYCIFLYLLRFVFIYILNWIKEKRDINDWLKNFIETSRNSFLIDNMYEHVVKGINLKNIFLKNILWGVVIPLLIVFIFITLITSLFLLEKKGTYDSLSEQEKSDFRMRYIKFAKITAFVVILVYFFYSALK